MIDFVVDGRRRVAPVWIPEDFDASREWPLVVFLHAYEERGDRFEHVQVGLGPALESNPELFQCIVLMPQCPTDSVWSVVDRPWSKGMASAEPHIDLALQSTLEQYPIDREHIALTGASMGAYGVFRYGSQHPEKFSAFAPICGGGRLQDAVALADRAVWVAHGDKDDVVPVSESRRMVDAIRAQEGSGRLHYTELEGAGHDIWNTMYRDPEFVEFLLTSELPTTLSESVD